MFSLISRLQRKPEHVKRQIAFFTAGGITLVIGALWLMSAGTLPSEKKESIRQEKGPLAVFSSTIGEMVGDTLAGIQSFKEGFKFSETAPADTSREESIK